MNRLRPYGATLVLAVVVVLAGCGGFLGSPPNEFTPAPSPSDPAGEYVVYVGNVPAELESVHVTAQVVFLENPADFVNCYPTILSGPFQPTPTPPPPPQGDCGKSVPLTFDLADIGDPYSLGTFSATRTVEAHALIVTNVTATHQNGTQITDIKYTGGFEALSSEAPPDGTYGVELSIQPADRSPDFRYTVEWRRVE